MLRIFRCIIILSVLIISLSACRIEKADAVSSTEENEQIESSSDINSEIVSTENVFNFSNNDKKGATENTSDISSDTISSEKQSDFIFSQGDKNEAIQTQVTRISSSKLSQIDSGCTYNEIISVLGQSTNKFETNIKIYLVDEKYLFVLRFENINDICEKSGKAMLEEAKSIYPPSEFNEQINKPSTVYGIIIDEKFMCCIGNPDSEFYALLTINAEIKFANGEKANRDDLRIMDGVIVTFHRTLTSSPPQLFCNEITIIR